VCESETSNEAHSWIRLLSFDFNLLFIQILSECNTSPYRSRLSSANAEQSILVVGTENTDKLILIDLLKTLNIEECKYLYCCLFKTHCFRRCSTPVNGVHSYNTGAGKLLNNNLNK
jgi:hypothetical protein